MNAGELRGQELIVGCLAASAAVAATSSLAEGHAPPARLVIGTAVAGLGLATVNMFAPQLAGGLAVLVLTTTVFVYGGPAMSAITKRTATPSKATTTHPNPSEVLAA